MRTKTTIANGIGMTVYGETVNWISCTYDPETCCEWQLQLQLPKTERLVAFNLLEPYTSFIHLKHVWQVVVIFTIMIQCT